MGDCSDLDRLEQIRHEQAEQCRRSGEENARKFFERLQQTRRGNGRQREEATALQVPATEDGIALAFAERHKGALRYDHTRGCWYLWDGARWKVERTQLAFDWARTICREYNKANQSNVLPKMRTASAVEKFAQADRRFAVTHEVWDANPWLLCTPGGTVDLRTGQLRENRRDDAITKITAVAPDGIEPRRWLQFLDEVTKGDKALQRFLQQMAGYCLTGDTREHALFFLFGIGGNGKGVFTNTLSDIMGDYAATAGMDTFTSSKYDRHPTELAHLCGARLVSASETEEGRPWAESRIKQLTGGDPVAARYMRQDFFEYLPQFKLVFSGNHKPVLNNVDEAARRRFHIVPFIHRPETPDKALPQKLKVEYPGILQWAIEGCLDWRTNGLVVPYPLKRETETYLDAQDTFSQWLDECIDRKSEMSGEPTARLFESWAAWAKKQGEDAGNSKRLAERLVSAGFRRVKNVPGNHGIRGFVGIALKTDTEAWSPYAD